QAIRVIDRGAQRRQPLDHVVESGQRRGELGLGELDLLRVAEILEVGHGSASPGGTVRRPPPGRGGGPPSWGGWGPAPPRRAEDIAIRSELTLPVTDSVC